MSKKFQWSSGFANHFVAWVISGWFKSMLVVQWLVHLASVPAITGLILGQQFLYGEKGTHSVPSDGWEFKLRSHMVHATLPAQQRSL